MMNMAGATRRWAVAGSISACLIAAGCGDSDSASVSVPSAPRTETSFGALASASNSAAPTEPTTPFAGNTEDGSSSAIPHDICSPEVAGILTSLSGQPFALDEATVLSADHRNECAYRTDEGLEGWTIAVSVSKVSEPDLVPAMRGSREHFCGTSNVDCEFESPAPGLPEPSLRVSFTPKSPQPGLALTMERATWWESNQRFLMVVVGGYFLEDDQRANDWPESKRWSDQIADHIHQLAG